MEIDCLLSLAPELLLLRLSSSLSLPSTHAVHSDNVGINHSKFTVILETMGLLFQTELDKCKLLISGL